MHRDLRAAFQVGYFDPQTPACVNRRTDGRSGNRSHLQAIALGQLFRKEGLSFPDALYIDADGVMCLSVTGCVYGLFSVAARTFFIDADGRTLTLEQFKSLAHQHQPMAQALSA